MRDEVKLIGDFLNQNNIKQFQLTKIAGDASFRHYWRAITDDGKSLIIMSAPPAFEDICPFYKIDQFLINHNFSAPKIFAVNYEEGLMLLEDFGDQSYTRVLADISKSGDLPKEEEILYKMAVDLLLALQQITPPKDLPLMDEELLMNGVMTYIDWYLPHVAKKQITKSQIQKYQNIWSELFKFLSKPSKIVLRDYHADNLMILNGRQGYQNVGLLDFQDAAIGCGAYDLVSLLEDARRDLSEETRRKVFNHYLNNFDCDKKSFLYDYSIVSLQRNIRIVGVFSRLAIRDNKPQYLRYLPRVFGYINNRLQEDLFSEMKIFLSTFHF